MKETYKAVEVSAPGVLRVVERPVSEPGVGQVRIRVEACGVCLSDAATVTGTYPGLNLVVGVPQDLMQLNAFPLVFGGRSVYGALTGTAIETEDTLAFSVLENIRPMIDVPATQRQT